MNVNKIVRRSLTGFVLAGLLSAGAWARSGSSAPSNNQDNKDIRKDKRDLRHDRRDLRHH